MLQPDSFYTLGTLPAEAPTIEGRRAQPGRCQASGHSCPPPRHAAKVSQLKHARTSNCTQAPVQERAKRKTGKKRKGAEEAW